MDLRYFENLEFEACCRHSFLKEAHIVVTDNAKTVLLMEKRKRGRPGLANKTLIRQ